MTTKELTGQAKAARATWLLTIHETMTTAELAEDLGVSQQAMRYVLDNISLGDVPIYEPVKGVVALRDDHPPQPTPADNNLMRGYLDVEMVSDMLGVHPETVRRRIRDGLIPAIKIGNKYMIAEEDL